MIHPPKEFEFESPALARFENKINAESNLLILQVIREHSPAQIGDIVTSYYGDENQKLQVTGVELLGIDSFWDPIFSRLSFRYEGIPVKKDGTPMQNRKPIEFGNFVKDGKTHHMPSYTRKRIVTATILQSRF